MKSLLPHLRDHFDALENHMLCFTTQGVQIEGWFKGELLVLLQRLIKEQVVQSFDREVQHLGAKIDLRIESKQRNWVELKHWLIGRQKGTSYGPSDYFRDSSSVGIIGDVRKLRSCPVGDQRWLLILASANPGSDKWQNGITGFNEKFHPFRIQSHTDPSQFPASYFLGLLEVEIESPFNLESKSIPISLS
jgi:hypothetical protein